jgi:hypothetical protein
MPLEYNVLGSPGRKGSRDLGIRLGRGIGRSPGRDGLQVPRRNLLVARHTVAPTAEPTAVPTAEPTAKSTFSSWAES